MDIAGRNFRRSKQGALPRLYVIGDNRLRRLRWRILLTYAGMLAEGAAKSLWPAACAVMIAYAAAAFGRAVFPSIAWIAWAAGGSAFAFLLVRGLFRMEWPTLARAAARVDGTLPGRPIAAILDLRAAGQPDRDSLQLWEEHKRRSLQAASEARAVPPEIRLAKEDPFGLRLASATVFAVAIFFAPSVEAPILPLPSAQAEAAGIAFDAWMQPPSYTGLRTLYLNDVKSGGPIPSPAGSVIKIREYGDAGQLEIEETVTGGIGADGSGSGRHEYRIAESGELRVGSGSNAEAVWAFEVIDDAPPDISINGEIVSDSNGNLSVPLAVEDDYGVAAVTIEIRLAENRVDRSHGLAPEPDLRRSELYQVKLPFAGSKSAFETVFAGEFSRHPWAGLPVEIVAEVADGAGQSRRVDLLSIDLPGRSFINAVAAALAEQRRDLIWSMDNARKVAQAARAITYEPEPIFESVRGYAYARAAVRRLDSGAQSGFDEFVRDEAAELLWFAALEVEQGNLASYRRRMAEAARRLAAALENGASAEEVERLANEYRKALDDFLRALAESSPDADPAGSQFAESRQIGQEQLQGMLEELDRLLSEGRTDEASQLLEELREIMNNLVGSASDRQASSGESMRQSINDFSNILREQQGLADQAYRYLQELRGQEQAGRSGANEGISGGLGRGEDHFGDGSGALGRSGRGQLRDRQEDLRRELRDRMRELADSGEPGMAESLGSFEDAARAMTRARERLADGDIGGGLSEQAEAMEGLTEGIRTLGENMQDIQGSGYGGPPGTGSTASDPFGRSQSGRGLSGIGEILDFDAIGDQRIQELKEEIRRRAGDLDRSQEERDYLMRLLERF